MTRVSWDETGKRFFEAGVDRGVIFPQGSTPRAWNGLTAVKEAPTDSETASLVQDGRKYRNKEARGSFAATLDCLSYPDVLDERFEEFGLSYRTGLGSDLEENLGYKLHLVYNGLFALPTANYSTMSQNTSPTAFSWNLTTRPAYFGAQRFSAHLVIDSTKTYSGVMEVFEDILYGTESTDGVFPGPQQVLDFFADHALIKITDYGDGTWSAEGPDELVQMLDPITFQIDSFGAVYIDTETYTIESW